MAGRIADFFRLLWALIYWNARKTLFRLRPGSRCPCQSSSDSGRAGETNCEASLLWSQPARFQRVCPLLVATPAGLRCSVNTADVRPFWGRAFRFYGTGLAALYVAATLALFVAMRAIGYPVSYVAVAWPRSWWQIDAARAEYFLKKGANALANNNTRDALSCLSYAYELAPHDYDIGFALASLWQINQPLLSDRIYIRLLAEHPEANDRTADAWNRALLARGDYAQIKGLAASQFRRDEGIHSGYWMQSLLFATRQTADDLPLRQLLASPPPLGMQWRKLVETELQARGGRTAQAIEVLARFWPEATHPYVPYYQARTLLDLKQPSLALDLMAKYGERINDDERYALRLAAFSQLGWKSLLDSDVALLLTAPPSAPVIELLGTHLAQYPNRAVLERVFARLKESPLAPERRNHNALVTLFCAAGVAGDFEKMHAMGIAVRQASSASPLTITSFEDFFQGKPPPRYIESFLPSLPLPLELTYAMLGRYSSGRTAAPSAPDQR